ncbi:MAG: hypothetical protein OEZ39_15785 [Gammaproteobacteria bacterium]|nr:hypothetical protein [Gammaproteobacteria bacterium]MDH5653318.1 hypothetical protein [Gammaproteobacteria bacterium]
MKQRVKIAMSELVVGEELPWSIYDHEGKLLLSEGQIIEDRERLDSLSKHGLFRLVAGNNDTQVNSPFTAVVDYLQRLAKIFDALESNDKRAREMSEQLAQDIYSLCESESDAAIALVHLPNRFDPSMFQPVQCAILCYLMTGSQDFTPHERVMIIAAALTSNIGMRGLLEQVKVQDTPLSATQRRIIAQHPQKGAKMLIDIGVKDAVWVKTVLQHHELNDGNGYPGRLQRNEIIRGAKILAIAERYSILITKHDKNLPISINDALKGFFVDQGTKYEKKYCLTLVMELTVFPPGSFVRLINGETAIVIKRDVSKTTPPLVKAVLDADNEILPEPALRDLTQPENDIMEVCLFRDRGNLDYNRIWGYI